VQRGVQGNGDGSPLHQKAFSANSIVDAGGLAEFAFALAGNLAVRP
jgi:hypothetical protein